MGGQAQYEIVRLVYQFAEWTVIVKAGGAVHFSLDDCWLFCYVLTMINSGQVRAVDKVPFSENNTSETLVNRHFTNSKISKIGVCQHLEVDLRFTK